MIFSKKLTPQELNGIQELHRAVKVETAKLEIMRGNEDAFKKAADLIHNQIVLVNKLNDLKDSITSQLLASKGFSNGERCGIDLLTGKIVVSKPQKLEVVKAK